MKTSRRDVLRLGVVAGGAGLLGGCAQLAKRLPGNELPASTALPKLDMHPTVRLLNRAGFGPRPGEVAAAQALGLEAWVDRQLNPTAVFIPSLAAQLARLDVMQGDPMELIDLPEDLVVRQLNQADLLRAVYSPWGLQERMVDLWSNHLNIYARKGLAAYRKTRDDREVIRKHALGKFPDMIKASAHSPAMLAYLDNQLNVSGVPNENYARELMELHTLGVHGGYTQKDVQEVARCLTGWTFERRFLRPRGMFRFDPDLHDDGEKTVLGHKIPAGGGQRDGEIVLDILTKHPACASFVASKLCRHFLGDADHAWRPRLAAIYLSTDGDIKSMLKPLLLSTDVLAGPPVAKRPVDYAVSALRSLGANSDCGADVQRHLRQMGQPLYEWPMPDGFPERASAWTGSLLARWNFALALAGGTLGATDADLPDLIKRAGQPDQAAAIEATILARKPADSALRRNLLRRTKPEEQAALCLASPDFQWR